MDPGLNASIGKAILNPLPVSWLGLSTAPPQPPAWANIGALSGTQIQNLLAQIGYDLSQWNYGLIGTNNQLGRYQFTSVVLENYGLLINGSNSAYGSDSVNYVHCWQPAFINNGSNAYQTYYYNAFSLTDFLTSTVSQEHLAYQLLVDLYVGCVNTNAIQLTDPADVVAGMMYVAWTLGTGAQPSLAYPSGSGAYAWRYYNIGNGSNSFNSGRYAVDVLSA